MRPKSWLLLPIFIWLTFVIVFDTLSEALISGPEELPIALESENSPRFKEIIEASR